MDYYVKHYYHEVCWNGRFALILDVNPDYIVPDNMVPQKVKEKFKTEPEKVYRNRRLMEMGFAPVVPDKHVVLPVSLQQIESDAFAHCTGLTQITIPATVHLINSSAFDSCNLSEIKFMGNAPTFHSAAFDKATATIKYPANNPTWTDSAMKGYGGQLTWIAYDPCETGHTYKDAVTEPNCTDKGFTTHTCSVCGDSYVDTYVDALGHDYQNVICTRCGILRREPTFISFFIPNTSNSIQADHNINIFRE